MWHSLERFASPVVVPLKTEDSTKITSVDTSTNLLEANSGARLFFDILASLIAETVWLAICQVHVVCLFMLANKLSYPITSESQILQVFT